MAATPSNVVANPTTPTLVAFPEELLQQIFTPLRRKDRKALRSTCKIFKRLASEKFFETIEIHGDDAASKNQLEHIVADAYWSGQVHSIVWYLTENTVTRVYAKESHVDAGWQTTLLQSLPNVQNVEFPRTEVMHSVYYPWNEYYYGNENAAWQPVTMFQLDLWRLMDMAHLKPATLTIGFTRFGLTYTPDGGISSVAGNAAIPDDLPEDERGNGNLQKKHDYNEIKGKFYPAEFLILQHSLIDHFQTLKQLSLQGLCVQDDFALLVNTCLKLESLTLTDVMLKNKDDIIPVLAFDRPMDAIKARSTSKNAAPLSVSFTDVILDGCRGSLTATNAEIKEVLESKDAEWSKPLRDSFVYTVMQDVLSILPSVLGAFQNAGSA